MDLYADLAKGRGDHISENIWTLEKIRILIYEDPFFFLFFFFWGGGGGGGGGVLLVMAYTI